MRGLTGSLCLLLLLGAGCGNRGRGGPPPPPPPTDSGSTDAGVRDSAPPPPIDSSTGMDARVIDAFVPEIDAFVPEVDAFVPDPDAGTPATTVYDIQRGLVAEGTVVSLTGMVVTGVWYNGVWVQDPTGGPYSGIKIYIAAMPTVARGDLVDVQGEVTEYFGDTELDFATITRIGTGPAITPASVTVSQAAGEPYEGVLVRLTDVSSYDWPYDCTLDNPACTDASSDLWQVNGPSGILVFDYMYEGADWASSIGDTQITGVMSYRYDRRRIMPRIAADLAP